MNKIYFHYGTMNSGKSQLLIQTVYNYKQKGLETLVLKPNIDTRETKESKIISRVGSQCDALLIDCANIEENNLLFNSLKFNHYDAVFIDEVQFLKLDAFKSILDIVENISNVIMVYGLRNGFDGNGFETTNWLLGNAEKLVEVKTMCWCGNKATHVLRVENGKVIEHANKGNIIVGGDDVYFSVCRKCFHHKTYKRMIAPKIDIYWKAQPPFKLFKL